MTRIELKKSLTKFFSKENTQNVMVIKGDWGVGKSYYIESLLQEIGNDYKCPITITSLFGVTSFSQCIDRLHYPVKNRVNHIKNIFHAIARAKSLIQSAIPSGFGVNINVDILLQTALSNLLRNGILIIDDIERKSDELKLADILGSINYLSEKQKIKIVLVFSENNLSEVDRNVLSVLREKTIDVEFEFKPSPEDNAKLITKNTDVIDVIKNINVNNIRIIKKIIYAYSELIDKYDVSHELAKRLYHKIGALCNIHFSENSLISIDDTKNYVKYFMSNEDESKRKISLLNSLQYHYDKRDDPIIEYLKKGLLNENDWLKSVESFKKDIQSEDLNDALDNVWSLFNSNFNYGYKETTKKFEEFLDANSFKLFPNKVLEIQNMLSDIGFDYSNKKWLFNSINSHLNSVTSSDIELLMSRNADHECIKILQDAQLNNKPLPSLEEAIKTIVHKRSWGQYDAQVVQNSSKEDYRDWMLKSRDRDLLSDMRAINDLFKQLGSEYDKARINLIEGSKLLVDNTEDIFDRRLNEFRINCYLAPNKRST